jgi:hypothetical protein
MATLNSALKTPSRARTHNHSSSVMPSCRDEFGVFAGQTGFRGISCHDPDRVRFPSASASGGCNSPTQTPAVTSGARTNSPTVMLCRLPSPGAGAWVRSRGCRSFDHRGRTHRNGRLPTRSSALLDLAEALGDSDGTESEEVDDARSELERLRGELATAIAE